jgi:hypothetical protein
VADDGVADLASAIFVCDGSAAGLVMVARCEFSRGRRRAWVESCGCGRRKFDIDAGRREAEDCVQNPTTSVRSRPCANLSGDIDALYYMCPPDSTKAHSVFYQRTIALEIPVY